MGKIKKQREQKEKGITLVALVVTIVILIMLAGITLSLVLGSNGILVRSREASTQTKQSIAEEDLKMMLAEYYTDKETGDTETLKDYLDKQVIAGKIDSEQANGSNYDVTLEGYICTVDSNTLDIISSSRNVVPQVSNVKVVANSDGTGDNLGGKSSNIGTKLYITFTAKMPDGSSLTVSPSIPYAVTQNGTYDFILTGKVDGKDTTQTVSVTVNQYKLIAKVGDFVNYTAGIWTQAEITSLGSLYSGASLPTSSNQYRFGGFKAGDSRDNSITPYSTYANKYSSGWRVLSLNGDGSIQNIVHAGTPEGYYHVMGGSDGTLDILTKSRSWNMYVNSTYATSAHCITDNDANMATSDLKTTGSYYWLALKYDSNHFYCVNDIGNKTVTSNKCLGVRPVVSLKSGIQITGGTGTWADPYQMQ